MMPRQKTYEEKDVLEKAMQAFWHHGYEATSVKDLVDCMGLNPGSIYAAFGDKKNLFHKTLAHYEDQTRALLLDLEENHTPRDAILAVFEHMVEDVRSNPENCGCFLINSILEASPKDEEINRTVQKGFRLFQGFMSAMIRKGQKNGEINSDLDPDKTASLLNALIAGARVLTRGNSDHIVAQDIAGHVEKILK